MRASPMRSSSGARSARLDRLEPLAGLRDRARELALRLARALRSGYRFTGGHKALRRPAFGAHERHEAHVGDVLGLVVVLGDARDAHQLLPARIAPDRNDEAPADLELGFQRLWHLRAAGRDDDRVVGRVVGPALRAVGVQDVHVLVAEVGEPLGGARGKLADALDRVDLARDARQDRRRVA